MSKLSTFLAEQILLEESTPIKKTIVVYVGRFQPFHKGHYITYSNLVKKFGKDSVYIGTSNKIEKPKSPFNFKEKKQIMTTMFGIPSNKIVEVKNPYAPTEILKNFDENTTAFVTVVGEKDSNRLGGKYFAKWDGHPTEGYKDRGYVYVSPAQPNAISGTDVRVGLGNGSEEQKQNYFVDRAYPKFNKQIFKLISDKLSPLNESLDESLNEVKWEESTYDKCMLGKLPLSLNIVKKLVDPIRVVSLHATDIENLPKVASLQGTKKSISTFTQTTKYGKLVKGKGMHTKGGIIVALSGVVLAQSIMDLWTEPDKQGRRWVNPGTIISGLGREQDVVFNFAPELKKYKEEWLKNMYDKPATNQEKAEFIKKYYDAAEKYMLSKKKEFQDKYLNSNGLYYDSDWNEVVLSEIKIEGILVVPELLKVKTQIGSWTFDREDKNETEKIIKQLKQKYKNVVVANNESDIQNFIKNNGGTIKEGVNEDINLDVKIGDTILMGKFKNKKVVVKSIGKDEHGMPTINGKKVVTFRMIEEGIEVVFEASNEDEKYTHIGYGRYKLKGKEDDKTSPTFTKDDSGKYIQSQSQANEPKSDTPKGTAVKGAQMFAHDPNVKQPTNTQPIDKDWTDGKDGWEILDDPRSKVKNVRKYTDEELQGETGEYFDNEITKKVAPNAFKDESDMIQKIKDAKPTYLSSEQMQNMNNTDIGDILSASENGGKSAMLKLGKERATKYGKNWARLEKGIEKGNSVPSPIALKDKTGQLHLLAGNTRLMSFTASGKKLPIKVIEYDGEFQYENSDSKKTDITKYSIKNLKRKISGWAEKEREFFTKNQQRPNSEVRRTIGEMIKDKAKGAVQAVKSLAKHEIKEFTEAGIGAKNFFKGEPLSDEEKAALKSVAFKIGTTALFGAVTGGLAHGAVAFGQHIAVEFFPHLIAETILKGVGKAALFAGDEEENNDMYLEKFAELLAKNMQEMKIPSDILQKAIMTYKSENETPQKSVKEQYLSDFKDMVDVMIAEELESQQNEMSKSQLSQVEKYAEKQLSPEDIEFTNHFFDRVNDPRNGKEISDAELTGFFKRLARHKKEFKEFLDKFHQIVVKDKRNDINIPFVKQSNHIIAKTVMRKDDFKSSNQTLTIEDRIPGGKSEGMNIYDIANYHNCDIDELSNQLQIGIKVELEHTTDKKVAEEIAMDHLYEDPKYYTKLATIEADEPLSEISAMGVSFENDGNSTTGYSWNVDWDDYDNKDYYLDNLEGWTTYSDIPSEYEKKKSTDQRLPIDNHEDGKTSKYNRILKYGFKEPAKFSDKSISETIIGNNIVCDNCGWSWKISEGGDDLYICHKCGNDNNPNVNEGYTKGQLFAGNLKIGGIVVPIEVELVGADNKKNVFITKVINIDKKYLSKLPSNGILEIPARIFRFTGGWRKIKTPSVFESILTEGGAYGHMNHPFDTDINLTFGQLKDIVNRALDGDLELAREKTDGQALAISWVGGRLVAARNKGHLKNRGAGALDIKGVADKFTGRGELEKAYNFAMQDLTKAIKSLSEKQREKIFKNGACFMNIEVIYPTSVNVIPYGQPLLVFHGTMEYDMEGNAIGEDSQSGKILGGMIKQVEQNVQANYTLQGPPVLSLPKSQNLSSKKGEYNAKISKLQREFGLGDTAGVAEYHQAWWENFVDKKSPSKLDNNTKMGLVKRWAFGDKGFRVDAKNITDPKVLDWAIKIDKEDQGKITKENLMKFEDIFLGVGAEVLSFTSSVLTVNPDKAVRDMKKRLDQTISDVKKSGDPKKIEKLKLELRRLSAVGGVDKIVPIEGIVFVYNGKTFKLTGSFASLNQLLGIFY